MSKITRQKAAQLLGVSEQTISNYWKEGLLGGAKGKGNILYINEDDLNRLAHEYKMTAASERLIELKQKKLKEMREKLTQEETELRAALTCEHRQDFGRNLSELVKNLFKSFIVPYTRERDVVILCDFADGLSLSEISGKQGISVERCRQLLVRTMKHFEDTNKIHENWKFYVEVMDENNYLRKENAILKEKYESEKVLPDEDMRYITTLLSTRLVDLDLNVRVLNCLIHQGGMDTIDDLLKTPKTEILKLRNMGKKSFGELMEVADGLKLIWRNYEESDADFYERLIKHMRREDE